MGFFAWIFLGLIAGIIAKFVVPGSAPGGLIGDIIIGIIGAFIGGFVYGLFGHAGVTGFNFGSILCAVIGAIILLLIVHAVTGRKTPA
jgi:uncharacterized membrane protein YeaQ/YmgE (transglycosylase-associated protein family)